MVGPGGPVDGDYEEETYGDGPAVDGPATGRSHRLPDHWHGVVTSPGQWGRLHVGDLLLVVGFAVLPGGVIARVLGSQAAMATVFGVGCALAGAGTLLAPAKRMELIERRRQDPHTRDPDHHAPQSAVGVLLGGLVLFGAGLFLLGVGLRG